MAVVVLCGEGNTRENSLCAESVNTIHCLFKTAFPPNRIMDFFHTVQTDLYIIYTAGFEFAGFPCADERTVGQYAGMNPP